MSSPPLFIFAEGGVPVLVSVPHAGVHLPPEIATRLSDEALAQPDTDWHVVKLWSSSLELGASMIAATHSRYVIDLNRPPDDAPLYPGSNTPGLCATATFSGESVYLPGQEPGRDEISERVERYFRPYHERLKAALDGVVERHGVAVLLEAHSIRSRVPRLFDGRLPDLNLGTNAGRSAAFELRVRLDGVLRRPGRWSLAVDGRFKGGYITRFYGQPNEGVHAAQLEMSQSAYMDEDAPGAYDEERARPVAELLRGYVGEAVAWAKRLSR
jgi:N-formylglutamate deformylase